MANSNAVTLEALWLGNWAAVESGHDPVSRDPVAWLQLAIARWQQGESGSDALEQAQAMGAEAQEARHAAITSAQLSLGQALLQAGLDGQGQALLGEGMQEWKRTTCPEQLRLFIEEQVTLLGQRHRDAEQGNDLAKPLCDVVWALHHWLVKQNGGGIERADWFWKASELLQWRQEIEIPLPAWWPLVQEHLVHGGVLAWRDRADERKPASQAGIGAISRTLNLLEQLAALHEPPPEWIVDLQRALLEREADGQRSALVIKVPQVERLGPPVTLTAISSRLDTLPAVLESLRRQSYQPQRVHLHLSEDPYLLDQGFARDEAVIRQIKADGWVHVHWGPNTGPYRKFIPFLEASGYEQSPDDDVFITVDDDTIYPPRFIEYMVLNYERYQCIVAHRGRLIRLKEAPAGMAESPFRPYADWHDGVREPRLANFPTGQSGVLYRRRWFPQDLELEAALALVPCNDDIWLRWLTAMQGVQAVILQPNAVVKKKLSFPEASPEPSAQKQTLWQQYNGVAGGNDETVQTVQAYWQTRGFDLAALLAEEQERLADFY
jgi:hypothetical protein